MNYQRQSLPVAGTLGFHGTAGFATCRVALPKKLAGFCASFAHTELFPPISSPPASRSWVIGGEVLALLRALIREAYPEVQEATYAIDIHMPLAYIT
jgi:hypothetical protein